MDQSRGVLDNTLAIAGGSWEYFGEDLEKVNKVEGLGDVGGGQPWGG